MSRRGGRTLGATQRRALTIISGNLNKFSGGLDPMAHGEGSA